MDNSKLKEKEEIAAFQLRIPVSLNDRVEALATAEKRSKNFQIEWILEHFFKHQSTQVGSQTN